METRKYYNEDSIITEYLPNKESKCEYKRVLIVSYEKGKEDDVSVLLIGKIKDEKWKS